MEATPPTISLSSCAALLKRRWFPALSTLICVAGLGMWSQSLSKPVYMAEGKLKFERLNLASSLAGMGQEVGRLEPLIERGNPLATEAEVIRSIPVVQETIDQLKLKTPKGIPLDYSTFLQQLTVNEIRGADILKVSYRDQNPALAAKVVNTLMNAYMQQNILSRRSQAMAARKFIEAQLPQAEASVDRAEDALHRFKEANQVVALKEESAAAVSAMTNLRQQITSLQGQISDVDGQLKILQQKIGITSEAAIDMTVLSQANGVQESLKQLQQVETQLAVERSRFNDTHPTIASLENKRVMLQELLQSRISQLPGIDQPISEDSLHMGALQQDITREMLLLASKRQGLTNQLATLLNIQGSYQARTSVLPRLEKEQRELERKLEASQSTYTQLLQKDGEIRVAENQNVGNAQVISEARPPQKAVPSKNSYLVGLLGILTSGAIVYLLEVTDKSLKTIDQTKQLLGYPLLGVIPDYSQLRTFSLMSPFGEDPLISPTQFSGVGAAYRMLQANLKFLSSDKALKIIVMTSSVPKEGKSTVSAHLASTIAQSGKKVLLIDGDMHHPKQDQLWELQNEVGLSHLLVEPMTPEQAIKSVMPNLDVLTSGMIPPNALALLDSQRMATLIQQLADRYDMILIDAPPVNVAADAQIFGKMADGLVLLVHPRQVDIGNAKFAKERLEQSGQRVLGIVMNGCRAKDEPHSHYYFIKQYDDRSQSQANVRLF
ncbi:MAG: polysaccharide biosynthesis tyrosine autokinase [Synechococcales bacterium]|nr:polysaccharide biosynthesis tyrosine autokinase [Synechococcales bacterium]